VGVLTSPAIRTRAFIAAAVLLSAADALAQVHEGRTIVSARLVADTPRVQQGVPFTAGVHLTIAPGWHVYWENPGDTALPIQVTWNVAPSTASAVRWPVPRRFQEQGGVTVFGYDRETLLLSTITPPASLGGAGLAIKAKAEWLVCEKVCLPGEASLELTLPAGEPGVSGGAADIRRFAAQVPIDGKAAGIAIGRATARKEGDRWLVTLEMDVPRGRLQAFFPRRIDGFAIEHGLIVIAGSVVRFPVLPDEPELRPRAVSGVAVTDTGSFDVSATLAPLARTRDARTASR
jgi:thiol:disulfide interchange protein DsbD